MKQFSIKILPLLFLLLLLNIKPNYSQEQGRFVLQGRAKTDNGAIKNATINIYENSTKIKTLETESSGKFEVNLELNKNYIVEITKQKLVTKKLSIDTHVPEKLQAYPFPFKCSVDLFEMVNGLDVSALNKLIFLIPLLPFIRFCQFSSIVSPNELIILIPVTKIFSFILYKP